MRNPILRSIIHSFHKRLNNITGDSLGDQFVKEGLGSVTINLANRFIVLVSGILLARFLGKEQYGIYSYILSLIFVLIIPAGYGLSNLIVRETARGVTKENPNLIIGVWRWSFVITLILCGLIFLISALGLFWAGSRFGNEEINSFLWALCLIPLESLILLISAGLRGMKYINLGQISELLITPILFLILFIAIYLSPSIPLTTISTMAIRVLSTLVALVFSVIFLLNKTPRFIFTAKPAIQGKLWSTAAIPLALSSGLGMIKSRITILLMGFFVSAAQIGTFQVALSASGLASLFLQASDVVLAPHFASLYTQKKNQTLQQLVTVSTRVVSAFNIVITLLFIFFGKPIISFVFGSDLLDSYFPILIMLVGQLVNSFVGSVPFLLNMTGHENEVMKVVGLSSALNIITTLSLTPFLGITGGAIASAISLIIAQTIMSVLVYKRLGIISHVFYHGSS
ncbi:MAG: oligosaccharide flippase family protein [Brevefilum sp.]|jgi:O-antigen/teichoic acid export membrane protein